MGHVYIIINNVKLADILHWHKHMRFLCNCKEMLNMNMNSKYIMNNTIIRLINIRYICSQFFNSNISMYFKWQYLICVIYYSITIIYYKIITKKGCYYFSSDQKSEKARNKCTNCRMCSSIL